MEPTTYESIPITTAHSIHVKDLNIVIDYDIKESDTR